VDIKNAPSFCNACGRETDHDILWLEEVGVELPDGAVQEKKVIAVRCRGCKECAIREETWYYDLGEDGERTALEYYPPRLWVDRLHGSTH